MLLTNPTAPFPRACCVMLGNFDGFHRAHRALAEATVRYARENGLTPAACLLLSPPDKGAQLCTETEKVSLLSGAGIEAIFRFDFSALCTLSPEEFVEKILRKTINAKAAFCGYNYRFGHRQSGTAETLKTLFAKHGDVFVLPEITDADGLPISSSRIRALLERGEHEKAKELLGHPLSV